MFPVYCGKVFPVYCGKVFPVYGGKVFPVYGGKVFPVYGGKVFPVYGGKVFPVYGGKVFPVYGGKVFPVYGGKMFCFLCLLTVTNCLVGLRVRRTPHLLLLLCSQLYHLGFTIVGEVFMYMTGLFFKPTIEVVTFHLCGWCVLGVFFFVCFFVVVFCCWHSPV